MRLASRFGYANQIRRDRPLTQELIHYSLFVCLLLFVCLCVCLPGARGR